MNMEEMSLKNITSRTDLKEYLLSKGKSHKKYTHYTTIRALRGMLTSRHLWLSRMDQMNDKQEISKLKIDNWDSFYIMSLAYGDNENMAMWGLYGVPWEDAVCIRFNSKELNDAITSASTYKDTKKYETLGSIDVRLADVLYIGKCTKVGFTHVLKRGSEDISRFSIISDNELSKIHDNDMFAGMLKNAAWVYENEVRIRADVGMNLSLPNIAIEVPENLFTSMSVVIGPWTKSEKAERIRHELTHEFGLSNNQIEVSGFVDLVKYKVICDSCTSKYMPKVI